jgi:hypothetical protein
VKTNSSYLRNPLLIAALAAAGGLAMAACGSSSPAPTSSGSHQAPSTLTIAGAFNGNVFYTDIYLAQADGTFAKHNLTVKMVYDATPEDLVVSGQAGLFDDTATAAMELSEKGQAVEAITPDAVSNEMALVTSPKITSLAQLKALGSNCVFGAQPSGDVIYAYAIHFVKIFNLKCKVEYVASPIIQDEGVVSGRFSAIDISPFLAAVDASQGAHIVINPLTANDQLSAAYVQQYGLPPAINTAIYGEPSWLTSHSTEMKDFLAALLQEQAKRKTMSVAAIAAVLQHIDPSGFATEKIATLETSLNGGVPFIQEGPISPSLWTSSLKSYALWGEGFSATNPTFGYAKMVNNSYLPSSS